MIRIEPAPWREMVSHARKTYPNECCGAMLGSIADGQKTVHLAFPLENASEGQRESHYELRPKDLLRADKEARDRKLDLIGIYHSHPPFAEVYPSATDIAKAFYPDAVYIILAIGQDYAALSALRAMLCPARFDWEGEVVLRTPA